MSVNRRALLAMLAITLVVATPPLASAAKRSWAHGEIKLVTSKGLMTAPGGAFRPDDALSQGELAQLVSGLTGRETRVPASPSGTVTIAQLDAQLVDALGPHAPPGSSRRRASGVRSSPASWVSATTTPPPRTAWS